MRLCSATDQELHLLDSVSLIDGNAYNEQREAQPGGLFRKLFQFGHFFSAGHAPGGPEVQNNQSLLQARIAEGVPFQGVQLKSRYVL